MRHSTGVLTSFGSGWQKARRGKARTNIGDQKKKGSELVFAAL